MNRMDEYLRVEEALVHNRNQPARQVENMLWHRIAALLTNREAARFAPVNRYFNMIVRTRKRTYRHSEAEARLLVDLVPYRTSRVVVDELTRFARFFVVCTACAGTRGDQWRMWRLPACDHPVCAACWTNSHSDKVTTTSRATTNYHTWSMYYLRCGACGVCNAMDTDDFSPDEENAHHLDCRQVDALLPLRLTTATTPIPLGQQFMKNDVELSDEDEEDEDEEEEEEEEEEATPLPAEPPSPEETRLAHRIRDVADRFRRLHVYAFDRYKSESIIRPIRVELTRYARWLSAAMDSEIRTSGKFAWIAKPS